MAGVSTYTDEMADKICERIADGESLKSICEEDGMPSKATVFKWLGQNASFVDKYARAREAQADALFDEILSIADDGRNDWMERRGEEDTGWVANGENIRRAQLRIDARKWMAGKLRPKKYGEKLDIDGTMTHEAGDSIKSLMDAVNGRTRSK
ncbi:terminase small subunit protein [Rhizobium phage RHph_I1_23]|nr:terminase small subunit protein [Rhizobium phage RHph_I1_23]